MAKLIFQGEVKNQQNITDHAQGIQFNQTEGRYDQIEKLVKEIYELLKNNCTPEQNQEVGKVVQELSQSVAAGQVSGKDKTTWITKLGNALALGASTVTIAQAPYWAQLEGMVSRFFAMLNK